MRHRGIRFLALALSLTWICPGFAGDQLVVHEWGTFTELHNRDGISVGGINTDDEPVPDFVHRISNRLLQSTNEPWRTMRNRVGKAIAWNGKVTTRLETPVIYFYPPDGLKEPMKVDVNVQLRGGWLSEFYPNAVASAPGLKRNKLGRHAAGSLDWNGLTLGVDAKLPKTEDHVWLAPRKTQASIVGTPQGEAESYLFYRGVGSFGGPLRVETTKANQLRLHARLHTLDTAEPITIPAAWLVHIRPDGQVAYRDLGSMEAAPDRPVVLKETPRQFPKAEFSQNNLAKLREHMHRALVEDGLYADEATAMLSTWDRAYFRSPGLRLFYVLPRVWTDDRMPLTLSTDAQIERVMMGRIELITDRQQQLLDELASRAPSDRNWLGKIPHSPARDRFFKGDNTAAAKLGIPVPKDYQAYLNLGRFRNALIHNELTQTRNGNLALFAKTHGVMSSEINAVLKEAAQKQQVASAKKVASARPVKNKVSKN